MFKTISSATSRSSLLQSAIALCCQYDWDLGYSANQAIRTKNRKTELKTTPLGQKCGLESQLKGQCNEMCDANIFGLKSLYVFTGVKQYFNKGKMSNSTAASGRIKGKNHNIPRWCIFGDIQYIVYIWPNIIHIMTCSLQNRIFEPNKILILS